jgi:hypothetical protein
VRGSEISSDTRERDAMTTWALVSCIAALLGGWSFLRQRNRISYSCPLCGSTRADSHAAECPWKTD